MLFQTITDADWARELPWARTAPNPTQEAIKAKAEQVRRQLLADQQAERFSEGHTHNRSPRVNPHDL